jgi:hypothetical protein
MKASVEKDWQSVFQHGIKTLYTLALYYFTYLTLLDV